MVLSVLIATITAPGLLGSQEAIRQSQSKEKREEHRARRCNLIATCIKSSQSSRDINGRPIVLRNGRLWIDTGTEDGSPLGHPYAGYYLPYPDSKYEGLVTTITDAAPIMNWVYIDRETHQVRYGVRADAQPNLTGPFDCTRQDRRLTFDGWEGWCAVEEVPGLWALYFDVDDDGLKGKVGREKKVLELELSRKEKRFQKEKEARQQDQTTKRKVDVQEDAPLDQPLGAAAEAVVSNPGVADRQGEERGAETHAWRPLKIPKSIFDDPPPMVAPLAFRPRTPPPAYSPADKKEPAEVSRQTADREDVKPDQPTFGAGVSSTLSKVSESIKPSASVSSTPLVVPASASPVTEKRTTPKRSSGTKALAQAQKFEALAAGMELKDEGKAKESRRSSPDIQAVAYASSEYSNDGQELNETLQSAGTSPTPPPLSLTQTKKKPPILQQPKILTRPESSEPATDPAIFTGTTETQGKPSKPRRPTLPRQQPQQPTRPTQQSTSRTLQARKDPFPQRKRSSSEQPYLKTPSPIRPPTNATARTASQPARTSLARTMTTGTGNRGMASRFAERREDTRPMRGRANTVQSGARGVTERKTTSALFREIDELVSQEVQGSGVADGGGGRSRGSSSRRVEDGGGKARWK
ncbi:hypothetical protein J1614_010309 [Plenodomus biglobosus]|nr:hypothetical protein J1614_010309 [Plenodomus biglobosus]